MRHAFVYMYVIDNYMHELYIAAVPGYRAAVSQHYNLCALYVGQISSGYIFHNDD